MESVFLVYKTDVHHSYASRDLIGVATSQSSAIRICNWQAKKEGQSFDDDQKYNLQHLQQTQGYSGEGEFHYEEMSTNILL